MDLRLLRTFAAVVEHRSFTGAAAALGYTQSAVSQHIAALESSLGVVLFERRPFALTPAAIRLAEHAASILLRVDVATSELAALDRRRATVIAATPFAGALPEVARLLARGQRMERSATAELAVATLADVVTRVTRGECSVGVVDGIVGRSDPLAHSDPGLLAALVLDVSPLAVAMPDDHPFARRASLGWASVADARWIDAPALLIHLGPGAAQLLHHGRGRIRYGGTDPSVLGNLVAAGHGLALVPAWWPTTPGSATVPLAEPALVHRVEVLVLRQRAHEWTPLVGR